MWVTFGYFGIIAPYFLKMIMERTCTVNQKNNCEMIRNFYFLNFIFKTGGGIIESKCQRNGLSKIRRRHIQPEKQDVCLYKNLTLVSSPFMKMLNDHLIFLI